MPAPTISYDIIELEAKLNDHLNSIQNGIDDLAISSAKVQAEVSNLLREQIGLFELKNSKFIPGQDLRQRYLIIEEKIEHILGGKLYTHPVSSYLKSFGNIVHSNIKLHDTFNGLDVDPDILNPAQKLVFGQAKESLFGSGIKTFYKEPIQILLLRKVTSGATVSDMENIIEQWTEGKLSASSLSPIGRPIPNLSQYATQIARDISYQFNGLINEIIRAEYALDGLLYTGDKVKDSRPLCVYLLNLNRPISFEELESILKDRKMMPGRIPDTTVKNFCTNRGGYACRHLAFPMRIVKDNTK